MIALQLLGLHTTSSHEGKINRYPIPYVDIESPEAEIFTTLLFEKKRQLMDDDERTLRKEIEDLYNKLEQISDKETSKTVEINGRLTVLLSNLDKIRHPESEEVILLREEIEAKNLEERVMVQKLLTQFYENRVTSEEIRLIAKSQGLERTRLESQGAEIQENETDSMKRIDRLKKFQEEMKAFTEFLKEKFFKD